MASAGRDWLSFQRCDSRVLTRQLDIETSETRRVQLIAKSVKHPANAIGCRRAAGERIDCYYLGSKTLLKPGTTGLARSSKARVEQVRSLGVRRLGAPIGQLPQAVIAELDKALRLHLGL
jgi:hypothetical protein